MSAAGGPTVMQLTRDLGIGGAQENAVALAKYLPRAGCPTVVCTFADGPLRADLERLGVPVAVLPGRRHSVVALPRFLAEMRRRRLDLLRLVETHGVDVVQTRGLGTLDFLAATLRVRGRVRVWWTIENVIFMVREEHQRRHAWLFRPKLAAHRLLYRTLARRVDGVVAVSDDTATAFRRTVGYRGRNVVVVPNGVDVERYPAAVDRDALRAELGIEPTEHVMTMVGTFKRQKGHRFLVEAAATVVGTHPELRLLLVGDGQLRDEIERRVEEAGLADRVRFLGSRRDVPELLAASDSFVLPSLWEGLPIALIEAMASALPIVATAVSGTSQVMVAGETGWIVPPGDATALADAIVEVLSDRDRSTAMGAAARVRVASSFGAMGQAERLAALFRGGPRGAASAGLGGSTRAGVAAR
jgi:glycosyltransferase involved in cell wall biosynthesis